MTVFAATQTYHGSGWPYSPADDYYSYHPNGYYRPVCHSSEGSASYIDPQRLSMGSPVTPLSPPMNIYSAGQPSYRPTCDERNPTEWHYNGQHQEVTHFAQGLRQMQKSYDHERFTVQHNTINDHNTFHSTDVLTPPLSPSTTLIASSASTVSIALTPTTPTTATTAVCHALYPNSPQDSFLTNLPSGIPTTKTCSERHYCYNSICLDPETGASQRSFTRRADLDRHNKCHHDGGARFSCPRTNCHRKGADGFTRKDHLLEHRRGYHGEDIPKRGSRAGCGKKGDKKGVNKS